MNPFIYMVIALILIKSIFNGIEIRELRKRIKAIETKSNPESKEGL
jgi:hypothetical protein